KATNGVFETRFVTSPFACPVSWHEAAGCPIFETCLTKYMSHGRGSLQVSTYAGSLKSCKKEGIGIWPADFNFGSGAISADRRKNESNASQTVARRRGPGPCRVRTSAHSDRCRCRDRHHLVQGSDRQRLRLSNQRPERFLIAALHAQPQPPAGVSLAEAPALTSTPRDRHEQHIRIALAGNQVTEPA